MIIISSQKTTILDCNNGKIENCMIDYDEDELIAICDKLPNEQILIAGEYGGNLPDTTNKDERVLIQKTDEHITTITFILNQSDKIKVYENYGAYICGFSYDGNYFVIAKNISTLRNIHKDIIVILLCINEFKNLIIPKLRYNDITTWTITDCNICLIFKFLS